MTSNCNIIKIGNSNGIIIPAKMLKALSLNERDTVSISEYHGGILLKKISSQAAETAFSALDRWNEEHGYPEESIQDTLAYVDAIKSDRKDKDIPQW